MTRVTLSYPLVTLKSVDDINEHRDWLEQNTGDGEWDIVRSRYVGEHRDTKLVMTYDIADPKVAILFKLTFGGV